MTAEANRTLQSVFYKAIELYNLDLCNQLLKRGVSIDLDAIKACFYHPNTLLITQMWNLLGSKPKEITEYQDLVKSVFETFDKSSEEGKKTISIQINRINAHLSFIIDQNAKTEDKKTLANFLLKSIMQNDDIVDFQSTLLILLNYIPVVQSTPIIISSLSPPPQLKIESEPQKDLLDIHNSLLDFDVFATKKE